MRKNGTLSCALTQKDDRSQDLAAWLRGAVIALVVCVGVSASTQAVLINQETGEYYKPGMDDEGNFEEPPEWVPQVESQASP